MNVTGDLFMKKITAERAAALAGGVLTGPAGNTVSGVETDSRKAGAGSMFVALIGENNDGNKFAPSAYQNGCRVFLLSSQEIADALCSEYSDASVIMTEDSLAGMQLLAKNYLAECDIIKVAVTGSTGKTSTKEMMRCIFASKYRTICNFENFNNHIGVPLTAFTVEEDTEAGIFEMGMNHKDEISLLADIVRPETAAITNVGISHLGNLGSRENIMSAKMEITDYMDENSLLVYNSDNDLLSQLNSKAAVYGKMAAGESAGESGVIISKVKDCGEDGVYFTLTHEGESTDFHVPLPGAHNAWNASLAAGCALRYGISLKDSAEALKKLEITGNRLNIKEAGGIKVINDTYNASPDSVKAAIDVLSAASCVRRVALLADMFELGENSDAFHREIGTYAAEKNIDLVVTVGENALNTASAAAEIIGAERVESFTDNEAFMASAQDILRKGDAVLVKGSHGMHMDRAADFILGLYTGESNE